MARRLKVLMCAYACEPNRGSEPEVGWQWAWQMARFHDVTVLTRANNRPSIEQALAQRPDLPSPRFLYHDVRSLLPWKRGARGARWYYWCWQLAARRIIAAEHRARPFDLLHHLTYVSFRYPTAFSLPGVPAIWGPVGGVESAPWPLLPGTTPGGALLELIRIGANRWQSSRWGALGRRARRFTTVLAATRESQAAFARLGCPALLMPAIGLTVPELAERPVRAAGPLRLLFVGRLLAWKGIHLALLALRQAGGTATFTLIGDGPFRAPAQRLAQQLNLQSRVHWQGRLPRAETLAAYGGFDVFLFPSLHDSGGFAVLEAMAHQLPVICLDIGGPGLAVTPDCGVKITGKRRAQTIRDLAAAIRQYDQDRTLLVRHGQAARQRVVRVYDWDRKGEQMNEIYRATVRRARGETDCAPPPGSL